jgi:hypothetical protein
MSSGSTMTSQDLPACRPSTRPDADVLDLCQIQHPDEIGDLPLETQPKLLRFLDSKEIHPLGEATPQRVVVSIVAATNADLERMMKDGRFRRGATAGIVTQGPLPQATAPRAVRLTRKSRESNSPTNASIAWKTQERGVRNPLIGRYGLALSGQNSTTCPPTAGAVRSRRCPARVHGSPWPRRKNESGRQPTRGRLTPPAGPARRRRTSPSPGNPTACAQECGRTTRNKSNSFRTDRPAQRYVGGRG